MKNKIYIFSTLGLLFTTLLLLQACFKEEVKRPCNDIDDVTLSIHAQVNEISEFDTCTEPANATLSIITFGEYGNDTIYDGRLGVEGELSQMLMESGCGANNIAVYCRYENAQPFADTIFFTCCDTTVNIDFYRIEGADIQSLSCESIDTTFTVDITGLGGSNLIMGDQIDDYGLNSNLLTPLISNSDATITIELEPLFSLGNAFSLHSSFPEYDQNSVVELDEFTGLYLFFEVNTTEVGYFEETIDLPTTCTDSVGNVSYGNIKVKLSATVQEPDCECPYVEENILNYIHSISHLYEPQFVGTTGDFKDVFEVQVQGLQDGCYLQLKSIERYNKVSKADEIIPDEDDHLDWTIPELSDYEGLIFDKDNSAMTISSHFNPSYSEECIDTFQVNIETYGPTGELKGECATLFSLSGKGCDVICPLLIDDNTYATYIINDAGDTIGSTKIYDTIYLGNDDMSVLQDFDTYMINDICNNNSVDSSLFNFKVVIPGDNDVQLCSKVNIITNINRVGDEDDTEYYQVTIDNDDLSTGESSIVNIKFLSPDIKNHINGGHSDVYRAMLTLEATSTCNGQEVSICTTVIYLNTTVTESEIKLSSSLTRSAFNQISTTSSVPKRHVYEIGYYDEEYNSYGRSTSIVNSDHLSEITMDDGTMKFVPNTEHSFYFDVDYPNNLTLNQVPKLFLVDNVQNNFSQITSEPIANYSSTDEFRDEISNLLTTVFGSNDFTSVNGSTIFSNDSNEDESMWTPSISAKEIQTSGIDLNLGDVFLMWDPDSVPEISELDGKSYASQCNISLIYIENLSDGSSSLDKIGSVGFIVAYPLSIIPIGD